MIRERLPETLKSAMREKNMARVSTLRLIMAALKDRDIAVREKGNYEGIIEADILQMLQGMVKQRKESIILYEQGSRPDLVAKEVKEIDIIQEFLPTPLSDAETETILSEVFESLNAHSVKDMGRVMAQLRENYVGRMDFSKVAELLKEKLK
ncbi:MAG: glutamyl-tRNA amidotransferase [Alphaproteobacteria bacterium 16-39-46]|nr:MAG: glutamyl-tRNA amidotransferase [Alphaproteobacteria bacterium 16-39-46]OZA43976.1 MAG: glutamyl-tRNA amidotransferase [Alphaproteobacteria bacterium 17-39-52]HQS83443.1 GatB/YqeY domain-containing protein [Alphaproteobacteria bacterium]HQS93237.1 GatB/YqeY domain-containing protein [Alphaproteobacteria bacterium]